MTQFGFVTDAWLVINPLRTWTPYYKWLQQGKYRQAIDRLKDSLNIYEKILGPEHLDAALSLNNQT